MQNLKYMGATVIEFRFFNWIKKKKKKNMKNSFHEYYTHTTSNYIKFLILMVIFTLMLVHVETESENLNFLEYGRIGKHPMQSLYTRYYRTL